MSLRRGRGTSGGPSVGRGTGAADTAPRGFEDHEVKAFAVRGHDERVTSSYDAEDGRDQVSQFTREAPGYELEQTKFQSRTPAEVHRMMNDSLKR